MAEEGEIEVKDLPDVVGAVRGVTRAARNPDANEVAKRITRGLLGADEDEMAELLKKVGKLNFFK